DGPKRLRTAPTIAVRRTAAACGLRAAFTGRPLRSELRPANCDRRDAHRDNWIHRIHGGPPFGTAPTDVMDRVHYICTLGMKLRDI
ncbi:hypothetical protein, partial [uncultured Megasphaera sp.]|uniref:hypothetical protein n=1 Tax=uncultured Megasphaera sp. TaxID=165188 RepID=UPI0025FA7BB3